MRLTLIQQKIYEIRGQKVMLDFDLADLYDVETKALNQAVKRNIDRFPPDFMIRLSRKEWTTMRSQFVTASQNKRNSNITPFAFTEHGVGMVASVLKSKRAVKMNIAIVRAFITLKQLVLDYKDLADQISQIRFSVKNHSEQLKQIYNAIENLLEDAAKKRSWTERERIGFKK
ncbi:MAG: ORF6N domain-containing protein [Chitinophagaceae bacterium]